MSIKSMKINGLLKSLALRRMTTRADMKFLRYLIHLQPKRASGALWRRCKLAGTTDHAVDARFVAIYSPAFFR